MSWRCVHLGQEGDALHIDGVAIWHSEWRWQDSKTIALPHPLETVQIYSYMICEAGPRHNPVRFAASEMPNRLWAFYIHEDFPADAKRAARNARTAHSSRPGA